MKKFIGRCVASIGARLWKKGGFWNAGEHYENLTVIGKLGYNMFLTGLSLMGILPPNKFENVINQ